MSQFFSMLLTYKKSTEFTFELNILSLVPGFFILTSTNFIVIIVKFINQSCTQTSFAHYPKGMVDSQPSIPCHPILYSLLPFFSQLHILLNSDSQLHIFLCLPIFLLSYGFQKKDRLVILATGFYSQHTIHACDFSVPSICHTFSNSFNKLLVICHTKTFYNLLQ